MFSCLRSVLLRPELNLFRFKFDHLVLYSLTFFFQMVILDGETLLKSVDQRVAKPI